MNMGTRRLSGVVAASAACFVLGSIAAQATPVLDPSQFQTTYSGTVAGLILNGNSIAHPFHGNPTFSDSVSDSSEHGLDGHTDWSASTTNVYSPTPTLSVSAAVHGRGSSANADSSVAYYVTFQGPAGADDVADLPVVLTSTGSVDKTLGGSAAAYLFLEKRGQGNYVVDDELHTFSSSGSHTWENQFTVDTSAIYRLIMEVSAVVNDNGTANASIDPFFTLPAGYRVVTTALATTPIPATLPLFGAGLAGLAVMRRRKKSAR